MGKRARSPRLLDYLDKRLGRHSGAGPEYEFHCPFCIDREGSESAERKLWINVVNGKAYCFRCHYGTHSLWRFFRDLNGGHLKLTEMAILRGLRKPPEKSVVLDVKEALRKEKVAALEELKPEPLPPEAHPLAPVWDKPPAWAKLAVKYLKKRGVSSHQVAAYDLHYAPTGRFKMRVVFPVHQAGDITYFTTRAVMDAIKPKSLNPKKRPGHYTSSEALLNFDNVVGEKRVVIVEGPFDCMALPSTVALMGSEVSSCQTKLLEILAKNGTEEFVIALDSDAVVKADKMYRRLAGRLPNVSVLRLPDGDPWENRRELLGLMGGRGVPSLSDRVKSRLHK